jgi:hypothetical protein
VPTGKVVSMHYHGFVRNLQLTVYADGQFIGVDGRPVQLKGINW